LKKLGKVEIITTIDIYCDIDEGICVFQGLAGCSSVRITQAKRQGVPYLQDVKIEVQ
jgi:hypothetical protein